ncbi:cobalamin biosynthesis protein CobQ [Candidatus Gottesmanbacteria bacterium RIFOXYB1_FULL_47_11]|uniref:Lipid II isoglutaminyl synthase (glutamine-hydrolyzing) subunit GatD n=1 Tax=Candidatus Gottesmanbacteria bacterium RIFOXYB1_FULL_47_11 TaxID=1798401 RepID=A0A1F6BGB1_9BACT|nr:MAG: cobalamin biosynthesis protein CobQ [Candidatus Gottesmanbacteria bacterium RIFOXYB1_FULL_47_11]
MKLTIGWLYPELMSTYGDRGNIFVLIKRCEWRKIMVRIIPVDFRTTDKEIESCDLIFGGGAQDRQQGLAIDNLLKKGSTLKKLFDRGVPGLFVCGAPQLLGHYYMTGDGKKLIGLGIFDMESKHFGKDKPRCIGNTVYRWNDKTVVGFENHGGRTYLANVKPFATVVKGCGNNGEDKTEGAVYKNCIATYSHGPFLPKNPHVADWLIAKALEVKYGKKIELAPLDDSLEWQAHEFMLHKKS